MRVRVRAGDSLYAEVVSAATSLLTARAVVVYDSGREDDLDVTLTATGDRAVYQFSGRSRVTGPGWIVAATVRCPPNPNDVPLAGAGLHPGQCYVSLYVESGSQLYALARGYVSNSFSLALGDDHAPGSGPAWKHWEILGADLIGSVSANWQPYNKSRGRLLAVLAAYNASSDAASRTIIPSVSWNGTLPTGFALAANVWVGATITLTASQEGVYYLSDRFASTNTNGTLAYANTTTAPTPLPLEYGLRDADLASPNASEAALVTITIGSGHANDRWSAWVLLEEWVVP